MLIMERNLDILIESENGFTRISQMIVSVFLNSVFIDVMQDMGEESAYKYEVYTNEISTTSTIRHHMAALNLLIILKNVLKNVTEKETST